MRKLLYVTATAFTLGSIGHAWAASSVDLSVKGIVTPAACTPTLSSGGVVDHGKISAQDLKINVPTALPVGTVQLRVECAAATLIAVKSRDNRAGSSGENPIGKPNFGLGLVNGKKIGWFLLTQTNGQADGASRPLIESNDGLTWSDATHPGLVWQVGNLRAFAGAGGDTVPQPLQTMTVDVQVETFLLKKQDLPFREEFPIDGSATLDVVYL